MRILVIEDEPQLARHVVGALVRHGHAALAELCRSLVRKPRIHAALEDNALDLLYPAAPSSRRREAWRSAGCWPPMRRSSRCRSSAPVTTLTSVPIAATLNGQTLSGSVSLSPAPVISLTGVSGPEVVGGQPIPVNVTLNNFPRASAGAVISLTSGDTGTLQLPPTVSDSIAGHG